ncbi:MAG TPA: phospholipid carrier-dependent glycosyltransferase [Candidatus Limnocylindria bacterium]|nr:phospholipid carrier-dependent glycosyltransferase [Candidatus Limnocylindria bacterium]
MTATAEAYTRPSPEISEEERGDLRARLSPPMPDDGWWGWVGPLAVTLLALVLRLVHLGRPHAIVVDETYYVKDALGLLRYGNERGAIGGADDKILAGNLDIFNGEPGFVVHPPFGKWVIAAGEWSIGVTPWGWRLPMALVGTLSVLVLARVVRRMTRSTLLGTTAGLLLALDGLHLVLSRTAYLDITLMMAVLAAFGCLVVDRDRVRERALAWAEDRGGLGGMTHREEGPSFGFRPWRLAAGVALGLACGTKWSGVFYLAAFGLLMVWWDHQARAAVGVRHPLKAMLKRDAGPGFLSVGVTAVVVYVMTWTGWLLSSNGYARQWATTEGSDTSFGFVPAPLRSLWHYHQQMLDSSRGITQGHAYASKPWGWLILERPVAFFYETKPGCGSPSCVQAITALGNPAIWWGGCLALLWAVWLLLGRRDWRAGAALVGVAAGWLPWFLFPERTVFQLYSVVFLPFVVIAVVLLLGSVLGPPDALGSRRAWGAAVAGGYVVVVVVLAGMFWPVLTAQPIPQADWQQLMWFRSWI